MGAASTGFGKSQRNPPAGGGMPAPPFAANSADNGLSVDPITGRIVLGNDFTSGSGGGPATFLSDREIDLAGFNLLFPDSVNSAQFQIGVNSGFQVGDIIAQSSAELHAEDLNFFSSTGLNATYNLDSSGRISIFVSGPGSNASRLELADSASSFTHSVNMARYLETSPGGSKIGDIDGTASVTLLELSPSNGDVNGFVWGRRALNLHNFFDLNIQASLGDVDGAKNGTTIFVDDNAQTVNVTGSFGASGSITAGGGIVVNGGSVPMLTAGVAFDDNAGAALGTLANAPAVGNPTKWIAVDDAGTTRFIPAW